MSGARKGLLETIEKQRIQISKYELKIKDVVNAYKSLAKEKQALQSSLSALTEENKNLSQPENTNEIDTGSEVSIDVESNADASNLDLGIQKRKIHALADSLQVITDEKNKMESSLKIDRKRMIEEKNKIELQLKSETKGNVKLKKEFEITLQEMKSKVIILQSEREKDLNNAMLMLREVETRFTQERREREKLEKLIDDISEQKHRSSIDIGTRNQEKQQKQITDLQNELEQVRCRMKKAEEQCKEPPVLKHVQEQMKEMKSQYTNAIYQEKLRAEAAESSARDLSKLHEDRVVALEASLTELSQSAAMYDRTTQTHLHLIDNLKEKIALLTEENFSLMKIEPSSLADKFLLHSSFMEEDLDLKTLMKYFQFIWKQIKAKQKYETDLDIEDLLDDHPLIHQKCFLNYQLLQKEYEKFKLQSNPRLELSSAQSCHCGLQATVNDLKERVRSLTAAGHLIQDTHNDQVTALDEDLRRVKIDYDQQIINVEHDQRVIINQLEQQLAGHCQRSLATLHDRDEEIHRLSKEISTLKQEARIQPSTVAAALLSQVSCAESEGPFLHHLEQLARKELEVSELRKHKMLLEKSMREIQMNAMEKQENMQDHIDLIEEQIERYQRNISREGENLEYLKNIVLQYMTSTEVEAKYLILNAIAAVLKFTPAEMKSVKKCLSLWWWQNTSKSKGTYRLRSPSVGGITEPTPSFAMHSHPLTNSPKDHSANVASSLN